MTAQSKIVGVLGGMGPFATATFFQSILAFTPAQKDWDHLRIIVDNNPHIPSRSRHLLYAEASPFEGMLETCKKLQHYPVDLIVVPCNSASIFVPQLQAQLQVPVLNILKVASDTLARNHPSVKRAAVLGSYVTYKMQSYKPYLDCHGIEIVGHSPELQDQVQHLIESIKLGNSGGSHTGMLLDIINRIEIECGAQAVILACTEFGCIPKFDCRIPVIDSSLELARHVVSVARS